MDCALIQDAWVRPAEPQAIRADGRFGLLGGRLATMLLRV